jgi:putative endonuclease
MASYFVYVVRCADDTFYTGISTDVERRLAEHNGVRRGAKYTRARRPVHLAYCEAVENRSDAQRREHALKKLTRAEKETLAGSSWQSVAKNILATR